MKLLFITQDFPPGYGGIQTYSHEHAIRLAEECDDFAVICPDSSGTISEDSDYNFDVKRIKASDHLLYVQLFKILPVFLKSRKFNATFHAQWQTCMPAIRARSEGLIEKVFSAAHARELLYNPYKYYPILGWIYALKRRYLLSKIDHFFPVSNYTAGVLIKFGVDPDRITVVANGSDPELFKPINSDALKKDLDLENRKVILTVTRLVKRKGVDTVLRAISAIRDKFPNILYLIAGEGPEETRLKKLTTKLNLQNQVKFIGRIDYKKLPEYYNAADMFIMASRTELPDVEGYGIVFLEANACGKPVIGTNSGGVPDAIVHGKTGLIVPENNDLKLVEAISELLCNSEIATLMGVKGRERVINEMNWDAVNIKLTKKIKDLI